MFESSLRKFPDKDCIVIGIKKYTYAEVNDQVEKISKLIKISKAKKCLGIYSSGNIIAYAGILAALKCNLFYVPLNPKFPSLKNSLIIKEAKLEVLLIDENTVRSLDEMLLDNIESLIYLSHESVFLPSPVEIFSAYSLDKISEPPLVQPAANDIAYLLFTSGSTGTPKGVSITHSNVYAYIENILSIFPFTQYDRFSQTFDLTFDCSVHDMFVCYAVGGCLCVPSGNFYSPIKYIVDNQITAWFSVPTLGHLIVQNVGNKSLPSLKYSLFAGEPLSSFLAENWASVATNSTLNNIYGLTETTIGITNYEVNTEAIKELYGYISIGKVFSNNEYFLIGNDDKIVQGAGTGELCLTGSQVISSYYTAYNSKTDKFINKGDKLWFKTGDIVARDETGDLFFISRKDYQVKIRGYRVELEEINYLLKKEFKLISVISLGIKNNHGLYDSIVTFIETTNKFEQGEFLNYCKQNLPFYMVPSRFIFLKKIPLTVNGKADRLALLALI